MSLSIREAHHRDREELVPLLLQAEPSRSSLRWSLENLSDTLYRLDLDGTLAGAASVRWSTDPAEIVELAIDPALHRHGLGRTLVDWIVEEARRRGHRSIEVGTSNASLGNIAFYQKCGFRMHGVKRDYFWYNRATRVENGVAVRDPLMFRMDLGDPAGQAKQGAGARSHGERPRR